jgi:hypothetical protein
MAETCGFPAEVIEDARALRKVVRDAYPLLMQTSPETENSSNSLNNLLQHLLLLKDSTMDKRFNYFLCTFNLTNIFQYCKWNVSLFT